MKKILFALLLLALPVTAQAQTREQLDSVRTELVRSRAFVRAAETQFTKTLTLLDSLIAKMGSTPAPVDTTPTPPAPPVVVTPTDTTVRIYAQHDFNDNTYGPFANIAGKRICNDPGTCVRNQRVEILFERLDITSSKDRNSGVEWLPADGTQNTPFGSTIYVGATFTFPSTTPAARALIDAAAAKFGVAAPSETALKNALRKIVYFNPGDKNTAVLAFDRMALKFTANHELKGPPCTPLKADGTPSSFVPRTLKQFTAAELFDKPVRIEWELKRSSAVGTADAELRVWVNGVELPKQTNFCTNSTTSTRWEFELGQQFNGSASVPFFSERRIVDDVVVANKRPR